MALVTGNAFGSQIALEFLMPSMEELKEAIGRIKCHFITTLNFSIIAFIGEILA